MKTISAIERIWAHAAVTAAYGTPHGGRALLLRCPPYSACPHSLSIGSHCSLIGSSSPLMVPRWRSGCLASVPEEPPERQRRVTGREIGGHGPVGGIRPVQHAAPPNPPLPSGSR